MDHATPGGVRSTPNTARPSWNTTPSTPSSHARHPPNSSLSTATPGADGARTRSTSSSPSLTTSPASCPRSPRASTPATTTKPARSAAAAKSRPRRGAWMTSPNSASGSATGNPSHAETTRNRTAATSPPRSPPSPHGSSHFASLITHPDVGVDFGRETKHWHRELLEKSRAGQVDKHVKRPCPRCRLYTLWARDGEDYIRCINEECNRRMTREELAALDPAA